jgi:hypothetical protein
MITISHFSAGILVGEFLVVNNFIPSNLVLPVYLISALSANAPDVDIVFSHKLYHHRLHSPLHYPVTWAIILFPILAWEYTFNLQTALFLTTITFINILIHFLMDTFGVNYGICWLAPFSKREFSFFRLRQKRPERIKEWVLNYITHPVFYFEIALWIIALLTVRIRGLV